MGRTNFKPAGAKGTALASDVLDGKTFSSDLGVEIAGTMANIGSVTPSLDINGIYNIPEGYHNGNGQVTQSIPTKGAETFTPTTSNQTINSGRYLTGNQTIQGDSDLTSGNIKNGVNIFGVNGNVTPLDIDIDAMINNLDNISSEGYSGTIVNGEFWVFEPAGISGLQVTKYTLSGSLISGATTIYNRSDTNYEYCINVGAVLGDTITVSFGEDTNYPSHVKVLRYNFITDTVEDESSFLGTNINSDILEGTPYHLFDNGNVLFVARYYDRIYLVSPTSYIDNISESNFDYCYLQFFKDSSSGDDYVIGVLLDATNDAGSAFIISDTAIDYKETDYSDSQVRSGIIFSTISNIINRGL